MKIVLLALWLAAAAWASIGACSNATEFPTQPPSMSTIDSPGGSYSPGCTAVDKTFNNFSYNIGSPYYNGNSYLGWGSTPYTYVTAPYGSGTTPGDTAVQFSSNYWYADSYANGTGSDAYADITFTYSVQSTAMMNAASFNYSASASGYSAGYFVELSVCPGVTTFTSGCANEVTTYNPTSLYGVSFAPTAQLAVQMTVEYSAYAYNTTNSYSSVYWVEDDFDDTPEPSTFSLLAAGLSSALWLRRRAASRLLHSRKEAL